MNAPLAKEQIQLLMSNSLTYRSPAGTGLDGADKASRPRRFAGFGQWINRAVATIAAIPHRQAVLAELSRMSDRQLADIGLNRGELTQVFDPKFARARRSNLSKA